MSPRRKSIEDLQDVLSTTHHNLSVVEEEMEELKEPMTSATHRDPPPPEAAAPDTSEIDISLRIHEKVASVASKAYRNASAKSNILVMDKIAGIGLVKFDNITVGQLLGKGSFSNVYEITKISSDDSAAAVAAKKKDNFQSVTYEGAAENDAHTDTRGFLEENYERRSSRTFRYAVKYLKDDILSNPNSYAVGTVDLVVEGMFLASLTHPNIIKVRGLPLGGVDCLLEPNAKGYFLVLDRLFDTLTERIYNVWQDEHRVDLPSGGGGCLCLPFGKKNSLERQKEKTFLSERLKVAFDISAALKFLHSRQIIYRDIKPENLGFDIRGDIKLFDLGLVKELHGKNKKKDGNYKLSMAGTPRYMAPEVGKRLRYNLSADVYSFSMLLWEIITMRQPLEDFTYSRLQNEVFEDGHRPDIKAIRNKNMRELVKLGWDQNASIRPSMDTMYEELKAELLLLIGSEQCMDKEFSHDRRRSTHLPNRLSAVNVAQLLRSSDNWDEVKPEDLKDSRHK